MIVAALYVQADGCYVGLDGVDPWPEARDARTYAGPHAVVAHPPCQRWGNFWWSARHLGRGLGDDDGCFAAALASVRTYGGVLEHPKGSRAWPAFGLTAPPSRGGWVPADDEGGWTCCVAQRQYGHRATKWTWLYTVATETPELAWGRGPPPEAWISTDRPRAELAARGIGMLSKRENAATPPAFRDILVSLARGVTP